MFPFPATKSKRSTKNEFVANIQWAMEYDPHADHSNSNSNTPSPSPASHQPTQGSKSNAHSTENHFAERRRKAMTNIATIRSQLEAASTDEERQIYESAMKLELAALQRLNENESNGVHIPNVLRNGVRDPSKHNFSTNACTTALRKTSMPFMDLKLQGRRFGSQIRVVRVLPSSLFVGPLHSIEITFQMKSKERDRGIPGIQCKGRLCLAKLQDGKISRILAWGGTNTPHNVYEKFKISYRPEQQGLRYGLCSQHPQGEHNSLTVKDILVTTFTYANTTNATGSSGVSIYNCS